MISQHIAVDDLAADLADDAVAFTPEAPVDAALASQLSSLLLGAEGPAGRTGYIVAGPGSGAELRDVGQAALDHSAGSLETVIVRGPDSVAMVSQSLSRAEIESTQGQLLAFPDYVEGLGHLLLQLDTQAGGGGQWLPFFVLTLAAVVAIVVVTYASAAQVKRKRLTGP
ncbi:Rv1476 family membrane protein [Corynebacterium guangdongense]|uniref:Uncharacterized protein n=1 Tax=Corynebacterium guangdongense TaxID=1783348 RepID=A0ABU1ZWS9_9CORY|nr:DUF6676 family protein [Corynebacterium guangdongense]MDR7329366.1 hypothetical protein [Corynebacterium guangdongense]WJZ17931.1 hypothetical protein CGUA_06810 [Corynebacterium guangdongense]